VYVQDENARSMNVLHGTTALAVSATICHASFCIASALGQPAMHIPIITAVTVTLATVLPRALTPIVPSGEAIAAVLMQVRPPFPVMVSCEIAFVNISEVLSKKLN
jgi:hypothetical protein